MIPFVASAAACDLFPGSRAIADLVDPFGSDVAAFVAELERLGCTVHVSATWRPEQRAWLMRGAWDVAHFGLAARPAPRADIPITWTVAGAQAMVARYQLAARPSLTSRHIQRKAIDMTITGWTGTAEALYALGATYRVIKRIKDPPHWSTDGG